MLSVIIPALNAEATLAATLHAVHGPGAPVPESLEVILVDGGSTDHTRRIAMDHGAKVIDSAPGRGRQLALGAAEASGDWLLFLHADTILPDTWTERVSRFIANPMHEDCAAYFRLSFDADTSGARRVAGLANWRAVTFGLPYGDQGLVISRSFYDEIGGFNAELELMEDVDLVRRIGPMRLMELPASVTTSAAKYRTGGWWARPLRNLLCLTLYLLGVPAKWLKGLYG